MTYNPSIPQPGDLLSNSQGDILTNFTQINNIFGSNGGANHYAFNDATSANRGLHKRVDFPNTTTVSLPSGTASVLYSKTVSGVGAPFFSNSAGDTVLWRGGSGTGLTQTQTGGTPSNGAMLLPNGIAFIWGSISNPVSGTTYSIAGTGFAGWPANGFLTNCFNLQATANANSTAASNPFNISSLGRTSFKYYSNSGTINLIYYFAIGN